MDAYRIHDEADDLRNQGGLGFIGSACLGFLLVLPFLSLRTRDNVIEWSYMLWGGFLALLFIHGIHVPMWGPGVYHDPTVIGDWFIGWGAFFALRRILTAWVSAARARAATRGTPAA